MGINFTLYERNCDRIFDFLNLKWRIEFAESGTFPIFEENSNKNSSNIPKGDISSKSHQYADQINASRNSTPDYSS